MSNVQIKIKSTKTMLTHFKSEDYSIPLMLSEFIDNSISSWEKIIENKNWLRIEIIFRESYISDSQRDKKIIIKDNAAGMDFSEIQKAAQFYDSEGKGEDDLNQHGIGLKSALGWLGEDMTVFSKTKDDNIYFNSLTLDTTNFNVNDEWYATAKQVEINDLSKNILLGESGTTIIIDKIYDDDKFAYIKNEEERNALFIFLGWKYKYYIRDGLIINLSFELNDKDMKNQNKYTVGDFEIKPWHFFDFKAYISKKVIASMKGQDFNVQKEEIADEFQEEIIHNFSNNIEKIMNQSNPNSLKHNICNHILNEKPLLFKTTIEINGENFEIDLGIISSDSLKYSIANNSKYANEYCDIKKKYSFDALQGVSTFHHCRGIEIGPSINKTYWNKKMPETISFASNRKSIDGESTPIRLYGEIHLTNFRTEINKAKLIWGENALNNFKQSLHEIWQDSFAEILKEIVEAENKSKSNEKVKLKTKTIEKTINDSAKKMFFGTKDSIGRHECIEGKHNWVYKTFYNDHEYAFSLIEDKLDNKPFKCNQVDEYEYKIIYDFSHSIWYPINLDYANARTLVHPIIVTLALAQWIIDQTHQLKPTLIFGKKLTRIDIFSIIDDLVKNWKPYEQY